MEAVVEREELVGYVRGMQSDFFLDFFLSIFSNIFSIKKKTLDREELVGFVRGMQSDCSDAQLCDNTPQLCSHLYKAIHNLPNTLSHNFVLLYMHVITKRNSALVLISTARCSRWTRLLSRIPSHPSIRPSPTYSF